MAALTFVVSFLLDVSVPKKKEHELILNFKSFANQFKKEFFPTLSTLHKHHRSSGNT